MHKRTTTKSGNFRTTRTISNKGFTQTNSHTTKGSGGYSSTTSVTIREGKKPITRQTIRRPGGWVETRTTSPKTPRPKKPRSTSSRKSKSKSNNEMSLGYGIGMGLLFVAYSALEIISKF